MQQPRGTTADSSINHHVDRAVQMMQCDDHSFLDSRPAQRNRVVLHLDVDVRRAAIVSAREDGLKGGQAIDVSHDQAPQESQLIGLACNHPTSSYRPCSTAMSTWVWRAAICVLRHVLGGRAKEL